jgi:hypothetical protein
VTREYYYRDRLVALLIEAETLRRLPHHITIKKAVYEECGDLFFKAPEIGLVYKWVYSENDRRNGGTRTRQRLIPVKIVEKASDDFSLEYYDLRKKK